LQLERSDCDITATKSLQKGEPCKKHHLQPASDHLQSQNICCFVFCATIILEKCLLSNQQTKGKVKTRRSLLGEKCQKVWQASKKQYKPWGLTFTKGQVDHFW
jgi:hypothetical protein